MTPDAFRKLALALPEAVEDAHMGHPDFRVAGRIFATLSADGTWGMVKLSLQQREVFAGSEPEAFEAVPGGWGRTGATRVVLSAISASSAREALVAAWRNTAPKRLSARHEEL